MYKNIVKSFHLLGLPKARRFIAKEVPSSLLCYSLKPSLLVGIQPSAKTSLFGKAR